MPAVAVDAFPFRCNDESGGRQSDVSEKIHKCTKKKLALRAIKMC
jgi:hypothetical protein